MRHTTEPLSMTRDGGVIPSHNPDGRTNGRTRGTTQRHFACDCRHLGQRTVREEEDDLYIDDKVDIDAVERNS